MATSGVHAQNLLLDQQRQIPERLREWFLVKVNLKQGLSRGIMDKFLARSVSGKVAELKKGD